MNPYYDNIIIPYKDIIYYGQTFPKYDSNPQTHWKHDKSDI